jgi:hypothetical protein
MNSFRAISEDDNVIPLSSIFSRLVITVNAVGFVLSFFPWFEGTADSEGWADRVLGPHRIAGFRIDFVWFVASTAIIFFAGFHFLRRRSIFDALLCFGWALAFLAYIYHLIAIGDLDFG